MLKSPVSRFFSIFSFLLLFSLGYPQVVRAYNTKNVIVVTVDGTRNTEALKYRFLPGEVTHPYMPRIWGELRPQGTTFTNFQNVFATYTTPGHYNIVTGTWDWEPNTGGWMDVRPESPTIFEYARKGLGLTKSETWAVVGKGSLFKMDYSINPGYGVNSAASLAVTGPDDVTYQKAIDVLSTDHPRLLFINFEDVDLAGHTGDWNIYINAIRTADNYVASLWNYIQNDPFYKNNTTLIITTDHGRHDDAHGGFKSHTGMCDGDRDIMLLILGPDSPANTEVSTPYYHVDIAPTIGELMGFDTPFVEGNSIVDFINYSGTFDIHLRDHQTASYAGRPYMVWRENSSGKYEVYFSKYDIASKSWSKPLQLSSSGVMTKFSDISADKSGLHVTWIDLKSGLWSIMYRHSPDFGKTWTAEQTLAQSIIETASSRPLWVYKPLLLSNRKGKAIIYTELFGTIKAKYAKHVNANWKDEVVVNNLSFPKRLNATIWKRGMVLVYQMLVKHGGNVDWDIYTTSKLSNFVPWNSPQSITNDTAQSISPVVTGFKGELQLFWVDNTTGKWQLYMVKSVDDGVTWSTPEQITFSGIGAGSPSASWDSNFLYLSWIDYANGQGEVYYMKYDGAAWTSPAKISNALAGKVQNPRVLVLTGNKRIVSWLEISSTAENLVHYSIP